MTGIIAALAGSGERRYAGSTTVTTGRYYDPNPSFSFQYLGYNSIVSIGSVSPNNWASTGSTFVQVMYVQVYTTPTQWVTFGVNGSYPNSGWDTMTVASSSYSRSAASYSNDGTNTVWTWFGEANPFGGIGDTRLVTWS